MSYHPLCTGVWERLIFTPTQKKLLLIISNLLKINPDERIVLKVFLDQIDRIKPEIVNPEFGPMYPDAQAMVKFQVEEKTQCSVYLQNEIVIETDYHRRLSNTIGTHVVREQYDTYLCTSYAMMSTLRSAQMTFLVQNEKCGNIDEVRNLISISDGEYSFNKFVTLFTGCVSPRSLEGLVHNSIGQHSKVLRIATLNLIEIFIATNVIFNYIYS